MSQAYGATLIEHSLIEAGLPGSVKVDSQVDAAQGTVEQLGLQDVVQKNHIAIILTILQYDS